MHRKNIRGLIGVAMLAALAGCASKGDAPANSAASSSVASQPQAATPAAKAQPATPATKAQASSASSAAGGVGPGMNARGEVVDSSKVESGFGTKVKVGETEGEITGKPAAGSKFGKLKIGMSMKQVTDLIGQPSDQGAYITGKAFIPFYYGGDRHRYEAVYKGTGRLIFAGEGGWGGNWGNGTLIWIIHNPREPASR
ncbi:hypothetical protein VVD49_02925 [Uliginosibacterium sp. H3]|uniref:Lipoprotein n=1 Tax=Uliginosibacterium silvisoli TaxID=3114758 RepID=A0ABU6JZ04_9RHOO|nr:hypothetical protein [Uliginosibacterium sp. H3]